MERESSDDRAWRSSAEVWPGALARVTALALLLVSPWSPPDFGVGAVLWIPALVVLACWILTPELTDRGAASVPTLLLPLIAAILLGLLQLVPLPKSVLEVLSPTAQHWWGLVDQAGNVPDPSGLDLASSRLANHSVSLYPWAGKQTLSSLVFAAVFLVAGSRFFRQSVPFAWLCAAAAVVAIELPIATMLVMVDAMPLILLATAASLGLLLYPEALRRFLGAAGLAGCGFSLMLLMRQRSDAALWMVPAAGMIAVVAGGLLAKLPGRRATIPLLLVAAAVGPWIMTAATLQPPSPWASFLRVGSGFGSAALLRTDRPAADLSPASFIARVMVEGGWPALLLLIVGFWLFARSVAALTETQDRDNGGFLAAGLFFGPAAIAWLGFSDSVGAPFHLCLSALIVGAVAGRAALTTREAASSAALTLPKWLPAPTFGTLLLAASLWGASTAWTSERTRSALEASTLKPSQQMNIAEVDAALLRLRPLVHHGDAFALYRLAERRIDRFRLQTADQLTRQLKLSPEQAWRQSDPSEIFARANAWRQAKQSIQLEALRRETPVAQNLEQAYAELRAALAASPLASEIALRNAQLRFVSDSPVNEAALLQLAAERAAPFPELLYAIGLEEYFIGHIDRAAELWKATLQLSFSKLIPICRLLGSKTPAPRMLEQVLPNHPEAYLTFAELLAADERNAVLKVAALEYARKSLDAVQLPGAQRDFQRGRWHAGLREWSAAVDSLRAAVQQDAGNVRYRLALISALEHKGDKPAAIAEARRALEAQPSDVDLKATIARLEKSPPKADTAPKQPPK